MDNVLSLMELYKKGEEEEEEEEEEESKKNKKSKNELEWYHYEKYCIDFHKKKHS